VPRLWESSSASQRRLSPIPSVVILSMRRSSSLAEPLSVAAVGGLQSWCVLLGLGCRVVGACVLGQVADGSKQGRKGTLCWSMASIGIATLLMAALPHGAFKGGRGHWQALVLVALQGNYYHV
jgi:MFS family permease